MKKLFMLQATAGPEQRAHPNQSWELHKSRKTSCRRTWRYPAHLQASEKPRREKGKSYTDHMSIKKNNNLYRTSVADTPVCCVQTLLVYKHCV